MLSSRILTSVSALSSASLSSSPAYSVSRHRSMYSAATLKIPFNLEPLESKEEDLGFSLKKKKDVVPRNDEEDADEKGISRLQVPRQRYIPVSKAEILDAIVSMMFDTQDDARQFLLLSSCLDSILHAEHKSILEEMRTDYSLTHEGRNNDVVVNGKCPDSAQHIGNHLIDSSAKDVTRLPVGESRLAVATRFQRAFMQLLYDAQFEELSARDLMLTSALNSDYLLNLPIYVDWKRASESNAIIFRRGYATERQKGLLIVEKLDYIQSKLLQGIFFIISKPLGEVGKWINEAFRNAFQTQEVQDWLKKLSLFQQSYLKNEETSDNLLGMDQLSDSDLPIWLAAQRAVSRYEGFLSPVGPRGRLFRKLLAWSGLIPPTPETPFELDSDSNASEPHLRPILLSRISLSDIWRPATRKYCGNDVWKMLKTSISILLSRSILQEPAFQELILLYTEDVGERETQDEVGVQPLQLKIYERIPIPDLPVIFPHKKLSFRIIDTVRLDVASILGLSAFFINYKFEDILSSPSAIFLDAIAISALIIYVTRVALGYKQTWDRYQLLVNKTLYEKTLASGFGSVHFLLDASEQQQYKEAILTYAILLKVEDGQATCRQSVRDKCERFMYDVFKVKVDMPVDKALDTLLRLGLVMETPIDGKSVLQTVPCGKAYEALQERWNSLLV